MDSTETARHEHDRRGLRYASDCTDAEWAIIAPLLARRTKVGRPRLHRARDLWNAISTSRRRDVSGPNRPTTSRRSRRCSTISTGCATAACSTVNAVLVALTCSPEIMPW